MIVTEKIQEYICDRFSGFMKQSALPGVSDFTLMMKGV